MSAPSLPELLVGHWRLDPTLTSLAAAYVAVYLWAARRGRTAWPWRRTASFLGGVACVVVALESGIAAYDDQLLSVHMVQHMLLLLLAPLLLLGGRPTLLTLRALPAGPRRALVRKIRQLAPLSGPLPCLGAFSAVVVGTHLPGFYDATLRHPLLHDAEHVAYLAAGLLMWWPLLGADPVPAHRLGGFGRLVYLLAAMPAMALVGAFLNRAPALLYARYGSAAHALGVDVLKDQAQAGAIMWVAGSMLVILVGLYSFTVALVAEERQLRIREAHAVDPLPGEWS